jgi:hypothetical protein
VKESVSPTKFEIVKTLRDRPELIEFEARDVHQASARMEKAAGPPAIQRHARLKGAVRVSFVGLDCFALSTTTCYTKMPIKEGTQL